MAATDTTAKTPLLSDPRHRPRIVLQTRVVSMLIPMFYFSGIIPSVSLLPQYLVHRLSGDHSGGGESNATETECQEGNNSAIGGVNQHHNQDDVQSQASDLITYFTYAASGPAFLACLFLGGYADLLGRRPLLCVAVFTGFVQMLLISLIIKLELPLWVFYIARVIDGTSGSFYIIFVTIVSALGDIAPTMKEHAFWISVINCSFTVVSAIFSTLSGFIIDTLGFYSASLFSTAATGVSFLIAFFAFPETVTKPANCSLNILNNPRRILSYFILKGSTRRKLTFWLCILIFMFSIMDFLSTASIDALYQTHWPFCWSHFYVGLYAGLRNSTQFFVAMVLLKVTQNCVRPEYLSMISLLSLAASYTMEGFVTTSWQLALVPVVGILGATVVPVIRALLVSLANSADQATVLSSAGAMEVVCNIISSTSSLRVYSATVSTMRGAAYLLMASFDVVAFILFIFYLCVREPDEIEIIVPNRSDQTENGHKNDVMTATIQDGKDQHNAICTNTERFQ